MIPRNIFVYVTLAHATTFEPANVDFSEQNTIKNCILTLLFKGAFCLERTYIASLRVHLFLIISDDLPNDREGVFECQNMKVKLLAVILKPISTLSVQ